MHYCVLTKTGIKSTDQKYRYGAKNITRTSKMVEVGRDCWKSPVPTPLLMQVRLSWLPRTVSTYFWVPQRMETPSPSGQLVSVLRHPHRKKQKKCLLMVQRNLQFVPAASGPSVGNYWKDPGSILCAPYLQLLMHIDRSPLSLLSPRLNSPSSLSCLPRERCCSPFIISVALWWTLSMSLWVAQKWMKHSSADWRGRISLHLLGNVSTTAAQDTTDLLWGKGTWACSR